MQQATGATGIRHQTSDIKKQAAAAPQLAADMRHET